MRILITGGNGFIGSHFVGRAVKAGHEVSVLSRKAQPVFAHGQEFQHLPGGYEALAAHPEWLNGVETVVHAAWSSVPKTATADMQGDVQANVVGTLKLLEMLKDAPSLKHLVFLSSGGAVYGAATGKQSIREDHPLEPISAYGVGKLSAEKYCQLFSNETGVQLTIVRPSNPFGMGQISVGVLGVVSTFLVNAIQGNPSKIFGDGSVVRDYLHVSDLARFLCKTVECRKSGIYNCGSGIGTSINEVVEAVESALGRSLVVNRIPARAFDPPHIVLDNSQAKLNFGWTPEIPLKDGISALARELCSHAD